MKQVIRVYVYVNPLLNKVVDKQNMYHSEGEWRPKICLRNIWMVPSEMSCDVRHERRCTF